MSNSITECIVVNNTEKPVQLWLTLGVGEPFVQGVKSVSPQFKPESNNPNQGHMELLPGLENALRYTPPASLQFSGNFCFGSVPLNCPPPEFPNGVNLAEFTLNPKNPGGTETVDISCVAGVNAEILFQLKGGGAWSSGPYANVDQFFNGPIGDNVGRIGVFPYLCSGCTNTDNHPVCSNPPVDAPKHPQCQKEGICNVQRSEFSEGGEVFISFQGFIPVKS